MSIKHKRRLAMKQINKNLRNLIYCHLSILAFWLILFKKKCFSQRKWWLSLPHTTLFVVITLKPLFITAAGKIRASPHDFRRFVFHSLPLDAFIDHIVYLNLYIFLKHTSKEILSFLGIPNGSANLLFIPFAPLLHYYCCEPTRHL